jgi:hypothetical protein
MNLEWKHLPLILLGGAIGSGLGWLAAFMFKPGILPAGSPIGLHGAGAMFGAIAGVGFAVVAIVARAARDPSVGPARYFMRINGMGSTLIGHSEPRDDGSYVTTEWFTILWIPVFPVCRYRVTRHEEASTPFSTPFTIHEKLPVRLNYAARVYGITVLILLGIIGFAFLLFR